MTATGSRPIGGSSSGKRPSEKALDWLIDPPVVWWALTHTRMKGVNMKHTRLTLPALVAAIAVGAVLGVLGATVVATVAAPTYTMDSDRGPAVRDHVVLRGMESQTITLPGKNLAPGLWRLNFSGLSSGFLQAIVTDRFGTECARAGSFGNNLDDNVAVFLVGDHGPIVTCRAGGHTLKVVVADVHRRWDCGTEGQDHHRKGCQDLYKNHPRVCPWNYSNCDHTTHHPGTWTAVFERLARHS